MSNTAWCPHHLAQLLGMGSSPTAGMLPGLSVVAGCLITMVTNEGSSAVLLPQQPPLLLVLGLIAAGNASYAAARVP